MTGVRTDVHDLVADLRAEQEALDEVVSALGDEQWRQPTPSPGWTVADQVGHLTYFDAAAATAIEDPPAFRASVAELLGAGASVDDLTLHRHLSPAQLLAAWRANRRRLLAAAATLGGGRRLDWYGPSMSAKSFLTARLMECWAHGQDAVDAVGARRRATDRLRHIVRLGVSTRSWTYVNRGVEPPAEDVVVELVAPSGAPWRYGLEDADTPDVIRGSAEDFCLVVTQRRHVDDTALDVSGSLARDWMLKAQAFAGPPTDGPSPGGRGQG